MASPDNDPSTTLTILGSGTSMGVPVIGCGCQVCRSEDPRNKRTRASVYLTTPEVKLLVDTGPDLRDQCLREGVTEVDATLYTHQHSDHIMGFDDLRRFCLGEGVTLPIYGTRECLDCIQNAFSFAFDLSNWYPNYIKPVRNEVEGPFEIADLRIVPLPVSHGKVRTIGYQFERGDRKLLAYLPDCKTISEEALEAMQGVETLIIDAVRMELLPTHMSVPEALETRLTVGAGRTVLTHISCHLDHGSVEAELPEDVKIAYDGLKLNLD